MDNRRKITFYRLIKLEEEAIKKMRQTLQEVELRKNLFHKEYEGLCKEKRELFSPMHEGLNPLLTLNYHRYLDSRVQDAKDKLLREEDIQGKLYERIQEHYTTLKTYKILSQKKK